MSLLDFLTLLVIAAIAGGIGQALPGYSLGGFVALTIIGLVGCGWGYGLPGSLACPNG